MIRHKAQKTLWTVAFAAGLLMAAVPAAMAQTPADQAQHQACAAAPAGCAADLQATIWNEQNIAAR